METSSVIILDSDSDDGATTVRDPLDAKRKQKSTVITTGPKYSVNENGKRAITAISGTQGPQPVVRKRIKPTTITSNLNNNRPVEIQANFASIVYCDDWEKDMKKHKQKLSLENTSSTLAPPTPTSSRSSTTNDELEPNGRCVAEMIVKTSVVEKSPEAAAQPVQEEHLPGKNPIGIEFQQLLDACRKADPSKEMEMLIEKKLIRYYEVVHPDYVNSKSFRKAVTQVTADVSAHPTLVFLKLSSIVEELNVRRKSRPMSPAQPPTIGEDNEILGRDSPSSGSTKKDRQIAKLNRTLYCLTKRIKQLDQAEVDFNHEVNSTYLMAERYKKRAFEVYEKLCDITGESKNAHRLVRKPIRFEGTAYPEYNRTLQLFVNQTNTFPNFRDVLKCLEHCNTKFGYGLRTDQMNQIAQDAFVRIGRQLQKRRKTDLYETVVYHTGEEKDPALIDPKLREKLEVNVKHYSKVNQLIARYAQDGHIEEGEHVTNSDSQVNISTEPHKHIATSEDTTSQNVQSNPSSSHSGTKTLPSATETGASFIAASPSRSSQVVTGDQHSNGGLENITDTDDDEEDEDDDEDDDEFESTTKENVRPDNFEDIVISDDEELLIPES